MVEKICISLQPEDLCKLDFIMDTFCLKGITYSRSNRISFAIHLAYEQALMAKNGKKIRDD